MVVKKSRSGSLALLFPALLAPLIGCCSQGRLHDEEWARDFVFKETLARLRSEKDARSASWWFMPYYGRILRISDPYLALAVMGVDERRGFAVRQLEPYLKSTNAELRKRAAAYLYMITFRLHADAKSVLMKLDQSDPLVGAALYVYPPDIHERAREEARVPEDVWRGLNQTQKWLKLKESLLDEGSAQ
jgi:hypothetical protein